MKPIFSFAASVPFVTFSLFNIFNTEKISTGMTTKEFFKNYAEALLSYSPEKISEFYTVPMTVYSDKGAQQVTKDSEVAGFWKEGIKPYEKSKIVRTMPEIISEEHLSKKVTICKVLWKNYDGSDKMIAEETNFYILFKEISGYKIDGLIIMS